MKALIAVILAALALESIAVSFVEATKGMTPEEKAAYRIKHREQRYRRTGGRIKDVREQRGSIAIVNAQKRVEVNEFDGMPKALGNIFSRTVKLETLDHAVSFSQLATVAKMTASEVVIILTDSEDLPSLLIEPEANWASVNVAKLTADDKPTFVNRFRRELMRAFAFLCGAGTISKGTVIDPVRNPSDLDELVGEGLSQDTVLTINAHLTDIGVKPYTMTTYRRACEQGWAPAPTNEYQQAIWDEIHATPNKPMQIKFDPAAQKGKVTK